MVRQVFVYGTLRRGFSRYHLPMLARLRRRVEPALLEGTLYDLGRYPGLKLGGGGVVQGEIHLFEDIDKALNFMDVLEGYQGEGRLGNLFSRRLVEARDRRGRRRRCWTYIYTGQVSEGQKIAAGTWTKPS